MSLPNLVVLRDRYCKGMKSLNDTDDIYAGDCSLNIMEAMDKKWKTDAHFVTYHIPGEEKIPRLNKSVLSQVRDMGGDIMTQYIVLDFDNPSHAKWNMEFFEQWINILESRDGTFLSDWFCHYTTRSGSRLIYVLDKPLPVDESEHFSRLMVRQWTQYTNMIDEATSDWTRLFRLPQVLRDDMRSEDGEYFTLEYQDRELKLAEARLSFSSNVERISPEYDRNVAVKYEDLPDEYEAVSLVETIIEGRYRQTEWKAKAKRLLKNRESFEYLFGDEDLEEGERDSTLTSYIGQAVSMLYGNYGTTKKHVFGLFYGKAMELSPDENTKDWFVVIWDKIQRFWAVEEKKDVDKKVIKAAQELEKSETFDFILERMRGWSGHESLDDGIPKERLVSFIKSCLIAKSSTSKHYFVMNSQGGYDPLPVDKDTIIPRIKALGVEHLYDLYTMDSDGNPKLKTIAKILEDHCTPVREIRMVPGLESGYIQNLNKRAPVLYLPAYRRNPALLGEFNSDVDEWLGMAFGDQKPRMEEWIAHALDFEAGAICALSIVGAPKIGKKLLVNGLTECLETPNMAFAEDLVGDYQSGLLDSPFLIVNEGWPNMRKVDPSVQFRKLTAGDPFKVNEKFMPKMWVSNPARIIFTANNPEVIKELMDGKDLSPDDRKAIGERILHFDVCNRASIWLANKGDMKFTGRQGHRWIAGDSGQASNFIVAKHFLYLYENRHRYRVTQPGRLLVSGNVGDESDLMFEMMTQSGNAPIVLETLINIIERTEPKHDHIGWTIEGNSVYILPAYILQHFRDNIAQNTRETLSLNKICRVLRNLVESQATRILLQTKKNRGRISWQKIDPKLILKAAEQYGYPCEKLRKIVNK